jgi:hypothetical protein
MKTKAILNHLQEFGNITSWEAIKEYGCTRLSAVIWNLRHKYNLDITDEWVDFKDRYGQSSQFKKYILNKED